MREKIQRNLLHYFLLRGMNKLKICILVFKKFDSKRVEPIIEHRNDITVIQKL